MNRFTSKEILKGYAMACSDLIERGHADVAVSLLRHEAEIGVDDLKDLGLPRYDYQSLCEALEDGVRRRCRISERSMSMHPLTDEFKLGTCEWCGDQGEVYADTSRCEDCDARIVHCSICKQDQHEESSCRHVFQDQDFEWTGSGGYSPSDHVMKSFTQLLERMPTEFAPELRQAIASNEFHTFLVAPLIGGGGTLWLYGMPEILKWGDLILEIGESEDAEKFSDGYGWLASLYNDLTPDANRTTLEWIDEHLQSADVLPFHKTDGAA